MDPRRQQGQATVEIALALPVLALLLAAVVQVGIVVADQARLWHAAREAARVAVVSADPREIRAAAEEGGLSGVEVSIDPEPAYRVQGEPLTVVLTYHPQGHVPLLGSLVERIELKARATMRIENP